MNNSDSPQQLAVSLLQVFVNSGIKVSDIERLVENEKEVEKLKRDLYLKIKGDWNNEKREVKLREWKILYGCDWVDDGRKDDDEYHQEVGFKTGMHLGRMDAFIKAFEKAGIDVDHKSIIRDGGWLT